MGFSHCMAAACCLITAAAQSFYLAGEAALKQQDWPQAKLQFERAIEADPTLSKAHAKLSYVLALTTLVSATVTSTADLPALARIIDEQQKALQFDSNNPRLLFELARMQIALARFSPNAQAQARNQSLALTNIRRAITLEPHHLEFRLELARRDVLAVLYDFANTPHDPRAIDEAVRQSEKALRLQPASADAQTLAAIAHWLRANPSHTTITDTRALSYFNQDRMTLGVSLFALPPPPPPKPAPN